MPLLQHVRQSLQKTPQLPYKVVTHLVGLLLMRPGHSTLRKMVVSYGSGQSFSTTYRALCFDRPHLRHASLEVGAGRRRGHEAIREHAPCVAKASRRSSLPTGV